MTKFEGGPSIWKLKIGWGGFRFGDAISRKRCEIELRWQLITNRKSYMDFDCNKSSLPWLTLNEGATVGYCQLSLFPVKQLVEDGQSERTSSGWCAAACKWFYSTPGVSYTPCPEKKRPRYFRLQISHSLVDFYNFYTVGNRNEHSTITCNLLS